MVTLGDSLSSELRMHGVTPEDSAATEAFQDEAIAEFPATSHYRLKHALFLVSEALAFPVGIAAATALALEIALAGVFVLIVGELPWTTPDGRLYLLIAAALCAGLLVACVATHAFYALPRVTRVIRFPAFWKEIPVNDFTSPEHVVPPHLRPDCIRALRGVQGAHIVVLRIFQRRVSVQIQFKTDCEAREGTREVWCVRRGAERVPLGSWDSSFTNNITPLRRVNKA